MQILLSLVTAIALTFDVSDNLILLKLLFVGSIHTPAVFLNAYLLVTSNISIEKMSERIDAIMNILSKI